MNLTRRHLLMGGAAIGALGLGVGVYAGSASPFDYYKAMLHAMLPGVNIPDQTIRDFTTDAVVGRNSDFAPKLHALSALVRVTGFPAVSAMMGDNFAFQKFNRDFLTGFLINSNFFDAPDPRNAVIEYQPRGGACNNPFAQFHPPT